MCNTSKNWYITLLVNKERFMILWQWQGTLNFPKNKLYSLAHIICNRFLMKIQSFAIFCADDETQLEFHLLETFKRPLKCCSNLKRKILFRTFLKLKSNRFLWILFIITIRFKKQYFLYKYNFLINSRKKIIIHDCYFRCWFIDWLLKCMFSFGVKT